MKLNEIKQIDIGGDLLEHYWPDDEDCFFEWVTIGIGVKGEEGANNYNLMVCTPKWIELEIDKGRAVWGRHKLIINKFDPDLIRFEIERKLDDLLEMFSDDDDVNFSEKIARYAHWEFEDYMF